MRGSVILIVAQTNMKKCPKTCTNCKFAYGCGYTKVPHGNFTYHVKKCFLTNEKIPYEYVKEKNNWCYIKPHNCPLMEI